MSAIDFWNSGGFFVDDVLTEEREEQIERVWRHFLLEYFEPLPVEPFRRDVTWDDVLIDLLSSLNPAQTEWHRSILSGYTLLIVSQIGYFKLVANV